MQERERLLREAFARYEAVANIYTGTSPDEVRQRWYAARGEVVDAVRAFCAAPASEVGEREESATGSRPDTTGTIGCLRVAEEAAHAPTSPAAPPEREPIPKVQSKIRWYEAASVPPEAAAETWHAPGCELDLDHSGACRIPGRAPTQTASPPAAPPAREGAFLVAEKGRDDAEAALATLRAQVGRWADRAATIADRCAEKVPHGREPSSMVGATRNEWESLMLGASGLSVEMRAAGGTP
jgi:hypothetical protein